MTEKELTEIKTRAEKAADNWTGYSNYPFDTTLNRPRMSLSKHDSEQYNLIQYLHCNDAALIVSAKKDILKLIAYIEELKK